MQVDGRSVWLHKLLSLVGGPISSRQIRPLLVGPLSSIVNRVLVGVQLKLGLLGLSCEFRVLGALWLFVACVHHD